MRVFIEQFEMNYGFNAFSDRGYFRQATVTTWRARLKNLSWLVGSALLALVLLRAAVGDQQDLIERPSKWSVEERRLEAVIADTKRRHLQFRRHQPQYSQAVVNQTREHMVRYIAKGVPPSVALSMAVQEAERGGVLHEATVE